MCLRCMASVPPDPYEVLGVPRDAQLDEIRSAYRKLILKCHPDKVQTPALKARKQEEFQILQRSYELLSDEKERERYDEQLRVAKPQKQRRTETNSSTSKSARMRSHSSFYESEITTNLRIFSEPRKNHSNHNPILMTETRAVTHQWFGGEEPSMESNPECGLSEEYFQALKKDEVRGCWNNHGDKDIYHSKRKDPRDQQNACLKSHNNEGRRVLARNKLGDKRQAKRSNTLNRVKDSVTGMRISQSPDDPPHKLDYSAAMLAADYIENSGVKQRRHAS